MINTFPSNKYANVTQCQVGQYRKSFLACGTATIHIRILNQNQCEIKEKSALCAYFKRITCTVLQGCHCKTKDEC